MYLHFQLTQDPGFRLKEREAQIAAEERTKMMTTSVCLFSGNVQVTKMLGNGRLKAQCFDGEKRLAHIRGKMRRKMRVD
ncbi:hypothetical protein ARMSODRAFT_950617 [Armillaria solidipes]|uniref:Eukaryotic translation initiation factor 4C n=1 Tax=Armillaria solidipes TaxID=1076256 RepID=A0A2H3CEP4_9AGAR|nr:hypothetical protein ARMSODRAFT_950617 [Armillaria solidipes]